MRICCMGKASAKSVSLIISFSQAVAYMSVYVRGCVCVNVERNVGEVNRGLATERAKESGSQAKSEREGETA